MDGLARSHWVWGGVLGTALGGDALSQTGVPYGYYAAIGATIIGIAAVVKAYDWVDKKWDAKLNARFDEHNKLDDQRHRASRAEFRQAITELSSDMRELTGAIRRPKSVRDGESLILGLASEQPKRGPDTNDDDE